jgi:Glu-tRNA(Gln) amidotransferase subunit E-like FAD-binding protein
MTSIVRSDTEDDLLLIEMRGMRSARLMIERKSLVQDTANLKKKSIDVDDIVMRTKSRIKRGVMKSESAVKNASTFR